jgi:RNA polymerase sigma factor (sigma-70 family)
MAVRSTDARTGADGEFLLDHHPFVLKLCHILMRNPADADDAAQQVFLHAYRALDRGVRPVNPRAWLAEIARNECRSRGRRAAARPEAPLPETVAAEGQDPADRAAEHALVEQLQRELADLPDRQRDAVLMREFRGLSYKEIAAELDETGPAVESLLQRARRRLVERLDGVRRPLVGVAFAAESARKWLGRLPGDAGADAATAGGTAVVLAKLAAVSAVALSVGIATGDRPPTDVHPTQHKVSSVLHFPSGSAATPGPSRRFFRPALPTAAVPRESGSNRRSGHETRPEETGSSDAGSTESETSSVTGSTDSSDSGSSGSDGTRSAGSDSADSGSSSLSSGPGDGLSGSGSGGSSGSSGSDGSGSAGSDSSGPGSSGSGSTGTSGHDETESSTSHG